MQRKNYWPILLAISIPILLILFMIGSIYLPQLGLKPKYNFLYTTDYYSYDFPYEVKDHRLTDLPKKNQTEQFSYYPVRAPRFFVYDVKANQARQVNAEEAKQLGLDDQPVSTDGYQVTNNRNDESLGLFPLLFFCGPQRGVYLKHKGSQKRLDLPGADYYNFHFIGWVTS